MSVTRDYPVNQGPSRGERALFGTVYFAFKPELAVANQAVSLGNHLSARHGLSGAVSPEVLHVTLCPLGFFPMLSDERIETACRIAGALVEKPFELCFDRVRSYPNGQENMPFVAYGGTAHYRLELFRRALSADLRRAGFPIKKYLPDPHMTLFYERIRVAEEPIEPIHWTVRDFTLIHSIHGQTRHVMLGQWPLRG